jgi:hypothetical protein
MASIGFDIDEKGRKNFFEWRLPPAPQPSDESFKKIDVNALVRETLAKKGIGLNG